ncbi:9462_t:CDS:2, partial [Cetraspora pellucida]
VNEGIKCVIPKHVMSIEPTSNQFFDLFDTIALGQYYNREVKVFIRQKKSKDWQEVDNGLNDKTALTQNKPDVFNTLMKNSKQLLLPRRFGWTGSLHEMIGKEFINHLTNALWYIDLYLSTLHAYSYHLLAFFTQLKTYQDGKSYNEYYYTSYHKKEPLSQQKLAYLLSSFELFISQPWA